MLKIKPLVITCSVLFLGISQLAVLSAQDLSRGNLAEENKRQANPIDSALKHDTFVSSYDQTKQPFYYSVPSDWQESSKPVLIFLHSWSANYKQYKPDWVEAAEKRGWIFLQPNFRGPNNNPQAGGSEMARQDILDCADLAISKFNADPNRVYLAGISGGGHMTLLMSSRHAQRFSAASAWVPISDLESWYRFHVKDEVVGNYAKMVASLCGGAPGDSSAVDHQYRERSPIHWAKGVGSLPVEIAAGVKDGKTGSVHINHSLFFFNKLAEIQKAPVVSNKEIDQLWDLGKLSSPLPGDTKNDPAYERELHLRRYAGKSRLTIFEGGHEGFAEPACQWLETHSRPTESTRVDKTK